MLICILMLFAIAATQARDIGPIPNAPAYSNLKNCHDLSQSRLDHRRAFSAPYRWSLRASLFQLVMVKVMPYDVQFSKDLMKNLSMTMDQRYLQILALFPVQRKMKKSLFQCRGERMMKIGVPKLYRYSWLSYEQHENHTEVR